MATLPHQVAEVVLLPHRHFQCIGRGDGIGQTQSGKTIEAFGLHLVLQSFAGGKRFRSQDWFSYQVHRKFPKSHAGHDGIDRLERIHLILCECDGIVQIISGNSFRIRPGSKAS